MKLYQNKEWLENQYKEIKHADIIGKIVGVTGDTIEYWRKKFNIPKHPDRFKHNRKNKLNEQYFKEIINEEQAYWLGFIMADGCITRHNPKSAYCRLDVILKNDDINHLDKLKKAISTEQKIKVKAITDKRGFDTVRCELRVSSVDLCNDLNRYGIVPQKTGKETIPDIDKNLVRHFIRGYFDGDGSLTKSNGYYSFKICSSSKKIIDQIIDYFKSIGIELTYQTYLQYKNDFFIIESRHKSRNASIIEHLYEGATIYLDRKRAIAMDILQSAPLCSNVQK